MPSPRSHSCGRRGSRGVEKKRHRSALPASTRPRPAASLRATAPRPAPDRDRRRCRRCARCRCCSRIISGRTPALSCSSRRHLPVRRRGRMAGERFRIAHIDQPLEQLERVVKPLPAFEPAGDAEGQERAGAAAEIFLRQRVIGIVRKAGIVDPRDAAVAAQEFGDAARILDMALDAQRHRLDALQQAERRRTAPAPRRSCADRRCGSARYRRRRRNARYRPGRDRTRRAR